jgi:hypothetical protein
VLQAGDLEELGVGQELAELVVAKLQEAAGNWT